MLWTITLSDDNNADNVFVDECPLACVKQLLMSAIRHDHHDLELFKECFELMDRIQDDPQDEYQIEGGDISERWRIVLKPASSPAGWDKVETSVPDSGIVYGNVVNIDDESDDDCERVDLGIDYESLQYRVEHECHRRGFAPRISEVPRRLWNLWSQQGQNLQQMAELVRAYLESPTTF